MAGFKCNGVLLEKTGICSGNYIWSENKTNIDNYFSGKVTNTTFDNISIIKPDPTSKHGFNVACVHIQKPYNELTECDYISYTQDNYDRRFHCQIIDREYVNANSTRLYFVIDYVATYFDLLEIDYCLVERSHVGGDGDQEGDTTSLYLLPEPVNVTIRHRPDLSEGLTSFDELNSHLSLYRAEYCLTSSVDENGKLNDPQILYQAGGAVSGYLYNGNESRILELSKKYVSYMGKLVNKSSSFAENITSIYACPLLISSSRSQIPTRFNVEIPLNSFKSVIKVKHKKVYDYFRVRIVGATGDVILSQAEYGKTATVECVFSGSNQGNCTLIFKDKSGNNNGALLSTPTWPAVGIAGNFNESNFSFAIQPTSMTDFAGYLQYFYGYNAGFPE